MTEIAVQDENKFEVVTRLTVSRDDLEFMLSCALEGGVNYWARVKSYEATSQHGNTYYLSAVLHDEDEDESWTVDHSTILKGLMTWLGMDEDQLKAAYSNPGHQASVLEAVITKDMAELDAGDCDTIVQMGLFGKNKNG